MCNQLMKVIVFATLALGLSAASTAAQPCPAGNLADLSSPPCVRARKCQKAIFVSVNNYVNDIQKRLRLIMYEGTRASYVSPFPFTCAGGLENGHSCLSDNYNNPANNGHCAGGTKRGAACSADSDCPSSTCNRSTACNLNQADDSFECQPSLLGPGPSTYLYVKGHLRTVILNNCQSTEHPVPISDIGFDISPSCPQVALATNGMDVDPPGYEALIRCMETTADGDFGSGRVVDTIMRPMAKAAGITKPQAHKSTSGQQAVDILPREMVRLAGSSVLQIGVNATENNVGTGGAPLPLSFGHCVGGNMVPTCLNNADCNVPSGGVCVRDACATCSGGSRNGLACVTGADCPSPGTCTGGCPASSSQFKGFGVATVGPSLDTGNVVRIVQSCITPAIPVCLVTRQKNAGNGTGSMGLMNFADGTFSAREPTETVVKITAGICPICDPDPTFGNRCSVGLVRQGSCASPSFGIDASPNPLVACTNYDDVDLACPPTLTGLEPKMTQLTELTTGTKTIDDSLGADPTRPGKIAGDKKLCGFCDTSPNVGCRRLEDCPAGATVCDYSVTPLSSGCDPSAGAVKVTASGEASPYAPVAVSLDCTGITGNSLTDGGFGLPGPVRSINPYVNRFIFSKDW